jgi:hypothetical protein
MDTGFMAACQDPAGKLGIGRHINLSNRTPTPFISFHEDLWFAARWGQTMIDWGSTTVRLAMISPRNLDSRAVRTMGDWTFEWGV